jgi:hypothetical protein
MPALRRADVGRRGLRKLERHLTSLAVAEHLGIHPKFTESTCVGGSSFSAT